MNRDLTSIFIKLVDVIRIPTMDMIPENAKTVS